MLFNVKNQLIYRRDSTKILPSRWCTNWYDRLGLKILREYLRIPDRRADIMKYRSGNARRAPMRGVLLYPRVFRKKISPYFSCAVGAELLCSSSAKWLSVSSEFPEKFATTWSMAYFLRQCYFDSFEKKKREIKQLRLRGAKTVETIFFSTMSVN